MSRADRTAYCASNFIASMLPDRYHSETLDGAEDTRPAETFSPKYREDVTMSDSDAAPASAVMPAGPATLSVATASGADFYSSALKALNGLFDLHVTTAVGHVKTLDISTADAASARAELDDPDAKIANTIINTVTGDTTVIYTGDFTSNADLMAIHKEALATAQAIRAETIGLIKQVIEDFADLLNGKLVKAP